MLRLHEGCIGCIMVQISKVEMSQHRLIITHVLSRDEIHNDLEFPTLMVCQCKIRVQTALKNKTGKFIPSWRLQILSSDGTCTLDDEDLPLYMGWCKLSLYILSE